MNPQHFYLPLAFLFVATFAGKTWYDMTHATLGDDPQSLETISFGMNTNGTIADTVTAVALSKVDASSKSGNVPLASVKTATNSRSATKSNSPTESNMVEADATEGTTMPASEPDSEDDALRETINSLSNDFYAQTTDEHWSTESSNQIYAYFEEMAQQENQFGSELRSVECRSSLCKVEVQHENNVAADEFFLRFPMSVGTALPNINYQFENLPDGKVNVLMFLAGNASTAR